MKNLIETLTKFPETPLKTKCGWSVQMTNISDNYIIGKVFDGYGFPIDISWNLDGKSKELQTKPWHSYLELTL